MQGWGGLVVGGLFRATGGTGVKVCDLTCFGSAGNNGLATMGWKPERLGAGAFGAGLGFVDVFLVVGVAFAVGGETTTTG